MDDTLGCKHYKRKVKLVTPCCNKEYVCRFCHDENEKSHTLDRRSVKQLVCLVCNKRQGVRQTCTGCRTVFGYYYCLICKLYDNEDKQQFHCDECGLCRIGGRDNFYHCNTCNLCLNINLQGNHKCIQGAGKNDCTVCLECLHTSRDVLKIPKCGHYIHERCFEALKNQSLHACPSCRCPWEFAM